MLRVVDGERGSRREWVEVLAKGVGGYCFVVAGDKLIEFGSEEI